MGCDSRFHSSTRYQLPKRKESRQKERNTEFADKESLRGIRGPFPVGYVVLRVHIEAELLCALCCNLAQARCVCEGDAPR